MKSDKKSGLSFWLAGGLVALVCFGIGLAFVLPRLMSTTDRGGATKNGGQVSRVTKKVIPPAVTDDTFQAEVLESKVPVLVDFWAPWCGPCRMMSPVVDEYYSDHQTQMKAFKLNCDQNQRTAMAYQVTNIPCFILFKDGQPVERIVGMARKHKLNGAFNHHLDSPK